MEQPRVNIIMVTFNGLEYTKLAIESLVKYTDVPCFLTVVDNGSSDGTINYLKGLRSCRNIKKIKTIINKENKGFGGAILQGSRIFDTEFVCMANNDIVFSNKWLSKMLTVFDTDPRIGLLGPLSPVAWCKHPYTQTDTRSVMSSIPDNTAVSDELNIFTHNKNYDMFISDILTSNKSDLLYFDGPPSHIMGFLSIVRIAMADQVGGIVDLTFQFGSDDTDLSWRLNQEGYRLAVTSNVYIHHFKHRSFKINKQDHKSIFRNINKKFYSKWRNEIHNHIIELLAKGIDFNELMKDEQSYEYWVFRRLNETIGFWKNGKLVDVNI